MHFSDWFAPGKHLSFVPPGWKRCIGNALPGLVSVAVSVPHSAVRSHVQYLFFPFLGGLSLAQWQIKHEAWDPSSKNSPWHSPHALVSPPPASNFAAAIRQEGFKTLHSNGGRSHPNN